ncbi:MAG: hypothetical protein KDA84_06890, partial [Planctomycetaceae bacterium]|nr:hypothetical protein [Planctomycetaceae bacterium]
KVTRAGQNAAVVDAVASLRNCLVNLGLEIEFEEETEPGDVQLDLAPWLEPADVAIQVELQGPSLGHLKSFRYLLIPEASNWLCRLLLDAPSFLSGLRRELADELFREILTKLRRASMKSDSEVDPFALDILNQLATQPLADGSELKQSLTILFQEMQQHANLVPNALTGEELAQALKSSTAWVSDCRIHVVQHSEESNRGEPLQIRKFTVAGTGLAELQLNISNHPSQLFQFAAEALASDCKTSPGGKLFDEPRAEILRQFAELGKCNQEKLTTLFSKGLTNEDVQTFVWQELKNETSDPWIQLMRQLTLLPNEDVVQQRLKALSHAKTAGGLAPEIQAAYGLQGCTPQWVQRCVVPQVERLNGLLTRFEFNASAFERLELLRTLLADRDSDHSIEPSDPTLLNGGLTCDVSKLEQSDLGREFSELPAGQCIVRKLGISGLMPAEVLVSAGAPPDAYAKLQEYVTLLTTHFQLPVDSLSATAREWPTYAAQGKREMLNWLRNVLLPAIGNVLSHPEVAQLDANQQHALFVTHLDYLGRLGDYTSRDLSVRLTIVESREQLGSRWRDRVDLSGGLDDWPPEMKVLTVRPIVESTSSERSLIHKGEVKLYL